MGMVYREIKQAVIDIEKMFDVLSRNAEIKDIPGATPLDRELGQCALRRRALCL